MKAAIKKRITVISRGETPEGYTRTKAGIIPAEWPVQNLSCYLVEYDKIIQDIKGYPVYTSSRQGLFPQAQYYLQQRFGETKGGYHVVPRGYVTYRHMSDDDIFYFKPNG